ncbi:hypothetical protein [Chlorogloea sp. CCALA 695]|uniref:hypothetical protein n=1 Tax=Chlorogloea sp. CCALA 695 TaxID=2107693 RepID=UPI000D065B22|nr:hypothetical protein [Chlorogloea sp. CCALA 695]PSB30227.1 hypothetical protein C7B70_16770 [Chlorogloea sp. CCALA 695]
MNVQWQRYKELELVPDTISVPKRQGLQLLPLTAVWRIFVNALMWEHFYEQRTDYLERCWELNNPGKSEVSLALQKLLRLMN